MKEAGEYKHATVRNKKGVVDEFAEYYTYHGHVIDTNDFYGSFDTIKAFFEQTPVNKTKIAGVREFLEYISKQLPTEPGERIYDLRKKIKRRKLMDALRRVNQALSSRITDLECRLEDVNGSTFNERQREQVLEKRLEELKRFREGPEFDKK